MSDYTTGNLTVDTWFRRTVTSGGCTSSPSAAVKVTINNTTPVITLTSAVGTLNQNICNDGVTPITDITYTITNSTGATVFNLPNNVQSNYLGGVLTISGIPSVEGTYTYIVKTTGSCVEETTTGTITVNPAIANNSTSLDVTICSGTSTTIQGSSTLGGNGVYNYLWESSLDGVSYTAASGTNNMSDYTTGNLTVDTWFRRTVTSGGCSNTTSPVKVTIDTRKPSIKFPLNAFSNNQEVCNGLSIIPIEYPIIDASDAEVVDLPVGLSGLINPTTGIYTISGSTTLVGSYNYTVKTKGSCGVATATGTITVNDVIVKPGLTASPNTICEGTNTSITSTLPTGGNGIYTYTWYTSHVPGGSNKVAPGLSSTLNYVTDTLNSNRYFTRIITSGGCIDSSEMLISVDKLPLATITNGNKIICSNESYTLPINAADTIHGTSIVWKSNGAGTLTYSPTTLLTPTYTAVTADAGKNVTVILTLTSNNSCKVKTDTASFVITVNPLPIATIVGESSHLCPADSITLKSFAANGTITWSHNGKGTILNETTINPTYVSSLLDAGNTVVLTMKVEACSTPISATANYSVVVYQLPVAPVNAGVDDTISLGSSITLNAKGSSIVTWNWSPSTTLDDQYISSPIASPLETTKYTIKATHLNGCISTDEVNIVVLKDYDLTISNLMTPNNDGKNDTWGIENIENYPGTQVIVVNREGEVVFEDQNYSNNWDGKFKGKSLPDATYYYIVKFANYDKIYKGAITLLNGSK